MLYSNRFILWDKIVNRVLSKKNFIWSKLSPVKICGRLYKDENLSVSDFIERLYSATGDTSQIDIIRLAETDKAAIIEYANHALNHEFNILGSGWHRNEPLDWCYDFINDFRWDKRDFYRNYSTVSKTGGRDIKVVWELSRCHHLLWLAEAYKITNDCRYSNEIVHQIEHWIAHNPLMYSINWTCSMDVAIRAVNWIYSLALISGSGSLSKGFVAKVMRSLFEHLFFIVNNLEKTIPESGNHYLSDIVGISWITPLLKGNNFSKICRRFALKEFYREALRELNSDGSNYENSVSYHRLVTELFIFTMISLRHQGQQVPKNVSERIFKAASYVGYYTKPNGKAPLIGDNDNGRLLPFVPRDFRDHRYIYEMGRALLTNGSAGCGEFIFLNSPQFATSDVCEPKGVADSGLCVLTAGDAYLAASNGGFSLNRCRQHGEWGGTHTHCDNLSFELNLGGEDFFVDPGCYVYTSQPEMRNLLRSTQAHNTLSLDDADYADFSPDSMFTMRQLLTDLSLDCGNDDSGRCIEGSLSFNNGSLRYKLKRIFELTENSLTISDEVEATDEHEVCLNFIIAPQITVSEKGGFVKLRSSDYELTLSVVTATSSAADCLLNPSIERFPYSPSYGILMEGCRIRYRHKTNNGCKVKTVMLWKK